MDSLALLTGLLEQYSPTGEEADACAFFTDAMRQMGFAVERDPAGNAVGWIGAGPREIMLLGHIDTVPGAIPVRVAGDRLYGRGAVDAKGPLACFAAAAALAGAQPGWRVRVIGAVGEEGDSRGARYLCNHAAPPDLVVIGEPSGWDRVTLGYKGSVWLRYTVRQPLAHTAARTGSACEAAVQFWNALAARAEAYNAAQPRAFDQILPTLRKMESGGDGFVETACLTIGVRVPPAFPPEALLGLVQEIAGAGEIEPVDAIPAYRAEKNTALVRAMLAAIRAQGGQPGFSLKTGTSDMNLVGPAWNCPILAYGPGDSGLDHTPDEHISISEYHASIEVLAGALKQMMAMG